MDTQPLTLENAHMGVTVDIRPGLPSLTVLDYPDRFSLDVSRHLREWTHLPGCLPACRITVKMTPARRRKTPSAQSVASYVQSLMLQHERRTESTHNAGR